MAKVINTRIQHKHDIEANWLKAINFIPLASELIIYDKDETYNYERFKIGDGITKVNDLPFVNKPSILYEEQELTDNQKAQARINIGAGTSSFSGNYNDLIDKPIDLATENYVDNKVAELVNSAPEALNTLNELAAALGDDPNFATTVTNTLAEKANKNELIKSIHQGNKDTSIVIGEGEAMGEYAIAGGTNDSSLVDDLTGSSLGGLLGGAVEIAKAEGNLSLSYGAGTIAHSAGTMAVGVNTIAGCKGFYWFSVSGNTLTLSTKQKSLINWRASWDSAAQAQLNKWAIGDVISIVNDNKYVLCSKITAINNTSSSASITVDSLPFSSMANVTLTKFDDFSVNNPSKPDCGVVELGVGAIVFGIQNKAVGSLSFSTGWNNLIAGDYGFTTGNENISGMSAFASGYRNRALGNRSSAQGNSSIAKGQQSHASGIGSTIPDTIDLETWDSAGDNAKFNAAIGNNSFVHGKNNIATNDTSIAMGNINRVTGQYSGAFGHNNNVTGAQAFGVGHTNIIQGHRAIGLGSENTIEASNPSYSFTSIALGNKNKITDTKSAIVAGVGNKIDKGVEGKAVLGKYNKDNSDTIFEIGIGTSDTDRKNGIEVYKNGNLDVAGNITSNGKKVLVEGDIASSTDWSDITNKPDIVQEDDTVRITSGVLSICSDGRDGDIKGELYTDHIYTYDINITNSVKAGGSLQIGNNIELVDMGTSQIHHSLSIGGGSQTKPTEDLWLSNYLEVGGDIYTDGDIYSKGKKVLIEGDVTSTIDEIDWESDVITNKPNIHKGTGEGSIIVGDLENNEALGTYSLAEGCKTISSGVYSHAEGVNSEASGKYSHAEGHQTIAGGDYGAHSEGEFTYATGDCSHAEGCRTYAEGNYSHSEGLHSASYGWVSHAEGYMSRAKGMYSHSEGYATRAIGDASHAQGYNSIAKGHRSHASGYGYNQFSVEDIIAGVVNEEAWDTAGVNNQFNAAIGDNSFVHGVDNFASGNTSMAMGHINKVTGMYSGAFGHGNTVTGAQAFAIGHTNEVARHKGVALGLGNKLETSGYEGRVAVGRYNNDINSPIFAVGIGNSSTSRKNGFEVHSDGKIKVDSAATVALEITYKDGTTETYHLVKSEE